MLDAPADSQSLAEGKKWSERSISDGMLHPRRVLAMLVLGFNPVSRTRAFPTNKPLAAISPDQSAVDRWHRHGHRMPRMREQSAAAADEEQVAMLNMDRRSMLRLGAALPFAGLSLASALPASAAPVLNGYDPAAAVTKPAAGRNFFPTLVPPLTNRATHRYDLGRDAWALEQLLVFANVSATIRTIVVKLSDGKLWVNSPQWPTGEFCALLDELGSVGHVVLPVTALEHKAPMQAFTKRYPSASVWVAPGQYGPFGKCGLDVASADMGYRVDGVLPIGTPTTSSPMPSWASEFEMRTLYVNLPENAGPVAEAAFLHKRTKTLITTDSVIYVPPESPPIFETYFKRAEIEQPDFWPKSVLQSVFLPLNKVNEKWPGYEAVQGRLLRAPILRAFADARAPDATREWVRSVASMGEFDRILTSHFASPISATPADYVAAFKYLDGPTNEPPIACSDWSLLDGLNNAIETNKLGAPVVYDFKQGCRDRPR